MGSIGTGNAILWEFEIQILIASAIVGNAFARCHMLEIFYYFKAQYRVTNPKCICNVIVEGCVMGSPTWGLVVLGRSLLQTVDGYNYHSSQPPYADGLD